MLAERTRRAQFFLGGRQVRHVAPAILLGVTAGAACGWNLTFALLVTLALWLNTPLLLLVSSGVAGAAMGLFCESLATTVGRALLDKCDLGSAFYTFAPGPTAALFGLDDYRLMGNLALGVMVGIPAAHALSRLLCRTPADDDEPEPAAADPLLRPLGFAVATACAGCTAATVCMLGPHLAGRAALERLTAALGAPVTVDRFDYDLWRGELEITNLRVGDAQDGRTVFTARRIEGRVEPGLFLRGRLHAEEFAVGGVSFDLSTTTRSENALAIFARRPSILKNAAPAAAATADPAAEIEVQTMLRHVSKTNDRLVAMAATIGQVEWIADLEAPHTAGGKRLDAFVRRKAAPRDGASGRATPLVKLKQVRIDVPAEFTELSSKSHITLANLTSRPSTAARHAQLTLVDEGNSFRLQTTFHLADPERQHAVTFELSDVAATDLVSAAAIPAADVRNSRVEIVRGNGTATRDRFDIRLLVVARGVKGSATAVEAAGVDGQTLGEALARLPAVQLAMRADGRWSQPRLSLSPAGTLRDLKTMLRANGAGELATAIETGKRPAATVRGAAAVDSAHLPAPTAAISTAAISAATTTTAAYSTAANASVAGPTTAGPAVVRPAAMSPIAGLPAGMGPGVPTGLTTGGATALGDPPRVTPTTPVNQAVSAGSTSPVNSFTSAAASPVAASPNVASTAAASSPAANRPTDAANLAASMPVARQFTGAQAPSSANPAGSAAVTGGTTRGTTPPGPPSAGLAAATSPNSLGSPGMSTVQPAAHTVAQRPTGSLPGVAPAGIGAAAGDKDRQSPVATGPGATGPGASMVLASDEFTPGGGAVAGPRLSTDGLRQPTSVLSPSAGAGPLLRPAGEASSAATAANRSYERRPEAAPSRPAGTLFERPGGDAGYAAERSSPPTRSYPGDRQAGGIPATGGADRGVPYGRNSSGEERLLGEAESAPRDLPTLPRRALIARDGTTPRPSGEAYDRPPAASDEGTAYDIPEEPKPAKKSIFSGVTKLFGKPEPAVAEDRPSADLPPSAYDRPEPAKSESFPMIRSLFGGKPKPQASEPDAPVERPGEPPRERGMLGGSKNYDSGKPKNAAPKGKGIFGFKSSSAAAVAATDERDFATPSGFVSDDAIDASARTRVPTAEYEAPVGYASSAVPAGGGAPRATDLEPTRRPEQISAGKPWYERMIR